MKAIFKAAAPVVAVTVILLFLSGAWAADPALPGVAGEYGWERDNESSTIEVTQLKGNRVHVTGVSYRGTGRESGPHVGEVDFKAPLKNGRVTYSKKDGRGGHYRLELTFRKDGLTAREEGRDEAFGAGVTFAGEYGKK